MRVAVVGGGPAGLASDPPAVALARFEQRRRPAVSALVAAADARDRPQWRARRRDG